MSMVVIGKSSNGEYVLDETENRVYLKGHDNKLILLGNKNKPSEKYDGDKINYKLKNILFNVFSNCNMECKYCFTQKNGRSDICISRAKDIINFFIKDLEKGDYLCFNFASTYEISVYFNEYKELQEYIQKIAYERSINVQILFWSTNGLLNPEKLVPYKMDNPLIFSIDGNEQTHDLMRVDKKGEGTSKYVHKHAFDYVRKNQAGISTVLHSKNFNVLDTFKYFQEKGFSPILLKPVRSINSSGVEENIGKTLVGEYSKFVDYLLKLDRDAFLHSLYILENSDYLKKYILRLFLHSYPFNYRCAMAASSIAVNENGDLYPCDSFLNIKDFFLGNIFTDDIKSINDKREKLYSNLAVDERDSCKKCWARYLCGGGCYYNNYINTGSIYYPDTNECELVKAGIINAVRLLERISNDDYLYERFNSLFLPIKNDKNISIISTKDERDFTKINISCDNFRGCRDWKNKPITNIEYRSKYNDSSIYFEFRFTDLLYNSPMSLNREKFGYSMNLFFVNDSLKNGGNFYIQFVVVEINGDVFVRKITRKLGGNIIDDNTTCVGFFNRSDTGFTYGVTIPWAECNIDPNKTKVIPFNCILNAGSELVEYPSWFELQPGVIVEDTTAQFAKLILN